MMGPVSASLGLAEWLFVNGAIAAVCVVGSVLYYRWAEERRNRR